jgi:hypothetical protein
MHSETLSGDKTFSIYVGVNPDGENPILDLLGSVTHDNSTNRLLQFEVGLLKESYRPHE